MAVSANGVARRGELASIPGGRLAAGRPAITCNAMVRAAAADGVLLRPKGPVSSFRPISAQRFFWGHQPPPAAFPGTSNHGWGLAVDWNLGPGVYAWLARNAHRFGWSHDEGARVGEPWHWRYVGGEDKAVVRRWSAKPNPLLKLPAKERKMAERLQHHRRQMRIEEKSGRGPQWHQQLVYARQWKSIIKKQMDELARDAHKSGNWKVDNRGVRRHILALVYEGKL